MHARRMLCIFNSLTGTLHGSIEEMISEQRMEEEAYDEEDTRTRERDVQDRSK